MRPLSRKAYALGAIVLAAVLFVAVNIVSDTWLRGIRLDLSEGHLFTVSEGTRATLAKIPEPITLRLFYSREPASRYAQVRAYAARVRDLLQEYAALANGKLRIEEIDPVAYTPEEDEAVAFGLSGVPTQESDAVYFGLAGTNSVDGREVIPFISQDREPYLEYDLTSLIYRLSTPAKPKLGVLTSLPLETGAGGMMAAMQGNARPFAIYGQLSEAYDVQMLDQDIDRIPGDVSTLLIAHPKPLGDKTLYAIDQFALHGGHIIVFVDPLSEIANASGGMQPGAQVSTMSNLQPLLKSWGVAYDASKVVADGGRAQRVRTGASPQDVADYVIWLRLSADNPDGSDFNPDDPVTASLKQINLASVGALVPVTGIPTRFSPLIESSSRSELFDSAAVRATMRPQDLLRSFAPKGRKLVLAARLSGPAQSAFPNGPPKSDAAPSGATSSPSAWPATTTKDLNVIVVADSDIFDDRFWVQAQNVLGQRVMVPTADNSAFVLNAVENMMGSSDLISLRTRARSDRPFTVVQALQREAEGQFLAEAQSLRQKVADTESRLRELETGAGDTQGPGKNGAKAPAKTEVLSSAQQAEIDKFRRQLVATRAALRQVQANLREGVETLGARLAFINIALMPILVSAFVVGIAYWRRRRRARARGF